MHPQPLAWKSRRLKIVLLAKRGWIGIYVDRLICQHTPQMKRINWLGQPAKKPKPPALHPEWVKLVFLQLWIRGRLIEQVTRWGTSNNKWGWRVKPEIEPGRFSWQQTAAQINRNLWYSATSNTPQNCHITVFVIAATAFYSLWPWASHEVKSPFEYF